MQAAGMEFRKDLRFLLPPFLLNTIHEISVSKLFCGPQVQVGSKQARLHLQAFRGLMTSFGIPLSNIRGLTVKLPLK